MNEEMTAREYMDSGDDWTSRIARLSLPILIWVAKQGKTITYKVSAPQTPFFPDSLGRDQMLGLEIPGQEGLEVFDSGRGR